MPKKQTKTSTIPSNYLSKVIRELESCPIIGARDAAPSESLPATQSPDGNTGEDSDRRSNSDHTPRSRPPHMVKLTVRVSPELRDRAKRAVAQFSGETIRLSVSELVRRGLERELTRLEEEYQERSPVSAE